MQNVAKKKSELIFFGSSFLVGKGGQFFIPIFLGFILTSSSYALIELSYAYALNLAALISFGTNSLIPRAIVKKESWINKNLIYVYILAFSSILFLVSILFKILDYESISLILIFTSITVIASSVSSILKSYGKRNLAIFNDLIIWGALVFWAVFQYLNIFNKLFDLFVLLWVITVIYSYIYSRNIRFSPAISEITLIKKHIRTGFKILIFSFLSIVIATSGRILMSSYLDLETFASYAQIYRITLIPLVLHQFFVLFVYRDLFTDDLIFFKKISSKIFFAIFFTCILLSVITAILNFEGILVHKLLNEYLIIFIACFMTIPFWSSLAINEISFSQYGANYRPIVLSALYIVIFFSVFIFLQPKQNIVSLALTHLIFVTSYYFVNSLCMLLEKNPLPKSPIILSFIISMTLIMNFRYGFLGI